MAAVAMLAGHRPAFSASFSAVPLDAFGRQTAAAGERASDTLTAREREVVQLLAEGHGTKAVADALAISAKTVETHHAVVMRKLGLHSLADLVCYAVRERIVEP